MARIKQNSSLPTSQRPSGRSRLLPFGIGGTLVLAGVLSLVSPFVGALVAATPLAYLTVDKVLRPSWKSFKQKTANVFRPNRSKLPEGHYGNLKVSDGSKTGNSVVDALVDKLRSNGLQVSTDWDAAKGILKQLPDKYETLKRSDARIYGFVYQGTIFLNPKDTGADVPIHEYTHVWAEALRQKNPDEWSRIKEMMKRETAIWNEVAATYPHLETDDQIADEVLATYSGRHGALRLQEHCKDGQSPDQVFKSLLAALERFWKNVSLFFKKDVRYNNAGDVADRVLSDFLTGVNPNKYIDENNITLSDEVPLASQELNTHKSTGTAMNEHLGQLLSAVLPGKGRIELPRVFGLDQPVAVGTYDMDAKYIARGQDGSYRFSDGEYSLPLSRLMDHQVDSLCQLLEEYQENEQLQSADREHNKVSEVIRNIRELVGSHAVTDDVDVYLQKPVSIGHGVQVMGVNVAMSNTHDDRLILRSVEKSDLYRSDFRYYDGGLHDGVKTYDTLNSKQLSAVYKELQAMEQRHTLFPVHRTYMYSDAAIIHGVAADRQALLEARRNPSIASASVYGGDLTLVRKENTGVSGIEQRLDKMFDNTVLSAVESLMSRNGVVREVDPITLNYNYAVILDTYSMSNLDNGEEPLKQTGGDALKSLEIIAKAYDNDAEIHREDDKIVKVTFSDLSAANGFASCYFRRAQEAVSAVKTAAKQGEWSLSGKAYVNAYIVEHGGVDKPAREAAAERLFKASDIPVVSSHKESVRNDLTAMAQSIPVVTYYSSEARDKFNEIMAGQQSTEVADYFPLHIGACGIFEETTDDGHHTFVAFDNSNGDNWTEEFKTMKGAELYVGGTLSAEDIHHLEKQQFRQRSKPLLIDTIILNKDNVSSSLANKLPFDDQGELEVKMAFFDGYAEELRQRDGVKLADDDRLKLNYPTLLEVANDPDMKDKIEHLTNRYWEDGSNAEKVYDIALKYGAASKLYERSNEVPREIGDVEHIAQEALYQRITTESQTFTGQQKQALSAYQQSFGADADKSVYLSERLMRGIQDRLASSGVPETVINDAQHEVTEFFRGVERDIPQKTEKDFAKLVLPYLNDKYEFVLIPASVPVHENPSGQYARQVNQTQDYIPQSLGILFNVEHRTMQVLYDHHHTMENGHEYHTVLGLPFDQLTPKEVNSLYDSLQGDLEENGRLLVAGITESEDVNEEVLFDVAFDVSSDDEQQALTDKHNVESVDEENNISSFNDYDDAIYFAAENLAALQQRPDIGQDLRDKSSVVDIIIARMKDPAARAFTPEQAQAVRDYITQSDDVKSRLADANDLYYSAASSEEVKSISSSWKEDVKDELSDLAKGIFRDESRGFHR